MRIEMLFKPVTFEFMPLVVWLLLVVCFVPLLRLSRRGAWIVSGALLVCLAKFPIFHLLGGHPFNPQLPLWFINVYGVACGMCWILLGETLLVLLALRIIRLCGVRGEHGRIPALVSVASAAGLAGWGLWEGLRVPRVKRTVVKLKGLPPAFDGLHVVQLSDLHACFATPKEKIRGIVERVNGLKPDLVVITGDFFDGTPEGVREFLMPLAEIKAPLGVWGCTGNHEYYSDFEAWEPEFPKFGVKLLVNAHTVIRRGNDAIALGGIVDGAALHYNRKYHRHCALPKMSAVYAGAPKGAYRILLRHQPKMTQQTIDAGVGLELSGHTHGGGMIGFGELIVKPRNENHLSGLYREGPLTIYVNPGTGQWAGFPLRLGVPSEITDLVLKRA